MKNSNINPNYWKVTKKEGYRNIEGHEAVGKFFGNKINRIHAILLPFNNNL